MCTYLTCQHFLSPDCALGIGLNWFPLITSFNPPSNQVLQVLLLPPFYIWGNWSWETLLSLGIQFSWEKMEHFKASLHLLHPEINKPDWEFFSFLNINHTPPPKTKKNMQSYLKFYIYFLEARWLGVVFFVVCSSKSSVGLICWMLDVSSSPGLSVALCSVLRTATISLCLLKEQVQGPGCWVSGKLICILLVTEAGHILVETMCCLINRLRPPVSAWSSASVWSAFVTRCCLFCLEVQEQDRPAKWTFYFLHSLAGIPWVKNIY